MKLPSVVVLKMSSWILFAGREAVRSRLLFAGVSGNYDGASSSRALAGSALLGLQKIRLRRFKASVENVVSEEDSFAREKKDSVD